MPDLVAVAPTPWPPSLCRHRTNWAMRSFINLNNVTRTSVGLTFSTKKQPKDKAMPKNLIGQRECCVEWITRPSPTASPNQSDDEDNDAADAEEGLLGMAAIGGISPDILEWDGVFPTCNLCLHMSRTTWEYVLLINFYKFRFSSYPAPDLVAVAPTPWPPSL